MYYAHPMTDEALSMKTPTEMAQKLAQAVRSLRLARSWTRDTLAKRAGVSKASLKRFENSGKASLELQLKVAHALGRLHEFEDLLSASRAKSLAELERLSQAQGRKRGSR